MNYIFCPSYEALFFALYLKVKKNKEIRIITYNESVRKFCGLIETKCFFFELPRFRHFYKLWFLKKGLDRLLRQINIKKEDNFFLFGSYIAYSGFYIAKVWARKGEVFFKELELKFPKLSKDSPYKKLYILGAKIYYRVLIRLSLGINFSLYNAENIKIVPGIDEKFLKENKIEYLKLEKTMNQLAAELAEYKLFDIGRWENLFMPDYQLITFAKGDSLLTLYKRLQKLPCEIVIKPHPIVKNSEARLKQIQQVFSNFKILPYYIPAELLFGSVKKNVLAISSSGLIAASKIKRLKAISLFELVEWQNKKDRQYLKDYLIEQSNNEIIFVKNFEELKKIMEIK